MRAIQHGLKLCCGKLNAIFGAVLLGGMLLVGSCNPTVGLGQKVDLTGPTIAITGPDYMANVKQTFNLTGTVTDDLSVANVIVKIEGKDCAWRNEKGVWQYQAATGGEWTAIAGGEWTSTGKASYNWKVPVTIPGVAASDFVIKVTSTDDYSNQSAASVSQRTLVCDTTPPSLTINSPILFTGTADEANGKFAPYALEKSSDLDNLLNGAIEISGSQVENSLLDRLTITIADASGKVYWTKNLLSTDDVNKLRNFSVTTGELKDPTTELPPTGKVALQIITESYDQAGNFEPKSNGWFCYWPASDEPWTEIPADPTDATKYSIYPGYAIQGQAFDDDGLKSVTISIYKGTSEPLTFVSDKTFNVAADKPKFVSWSINCPNESGTFTLVATCVDVNEKESAAGSGKKIGVFTVQDITVPAIYTTSPSETTTLFGDASGNFVVKGLVDDNSCVADLRIVWINPKDAKAADNQLSYLDPTYTLWKSDFSGASKTDISGNKVWVLSLGTNTLNANGRMQRTFEQSFSLFTDLGISAMLPLSNQAFILRAEDDSGKTRVIKLSTAGDTKAPTLTIDSVTVRSSGGTETPYDLINNTPTLSALVSGDTVYLKGTWKDDSTDIWADKSKKGPLSVEWGTTSLTVTANSDGTWATIPQTAPSGAVAAISASLRDYGGNVGLKTASFFVETDTPVLLRISSETADGAYKMGSVINVFLDFNKPVTFGTSGNDPSITLNNDAVAKYVSGNGGTRHMFSYTVGALSGENTAKLDVKENGLDTGNNLWRDKTGKEASVSSLPSGVYSLGGNKNIAIDNLMPTIASVTTVSASGAYKTGGEISLIVEFSESVAISDTALPRLKLKLTSGPDAYATGMNQINATKYIMSYTVAANQNATKLGVESFELQGAVIKDAAGNILMEPVAIPTSIDLPISVDTEPPMAPTIGGITNNTTYYSDTTFTVSGEAGATIQYSVDGGSTWNNGTSKKIDVDGVYKIIARQTDVAGNGSVNSAQYTVIVDKGGDFLNAVTSDTPDGIYPAGKVIDIKLIFRKPITVVGTPELSLNINPVLGAPDPVVYATYAGGSGSEVITFNYTVVDGQSQAARLNASAIVLPGGAAIKDGDTAISVTLPGVTDSKSLAMQKNITICTGTPKTTTPSFDGTTLVFHFDRTVYKGTGSLEITQDETTLRAPAVLLPSEYISLKSRSSVFAANYLPDTNGASATGVPDTGAKYVLKYGTSVIDTTLITAYKATNAHKVNVAVESSVVTVSDKDVSFKLSNSYALPVKGATYTVNLPKGLFVDVVGNPSDAHTATITALGVESPVVRVKKENEEIKDISKLDIDGVEQPATTTFKIDCETPATTMVYDLVCTSVASKGIPATASTIPVKVPDASRVTVSSVSDQPLAVNAEKTIGDPSDKTTGLKYFITARAKVITTSELSADAYEVAYRSVLEFNNDKPLGITDYDGTGGSLKSSVWVRGGDATSGSTLTSGFPLSWDPDDHKDGVDGVGIRLMTQDGNIYRWITWKINTTAYVGLLGGTIPSDAADKGPSYWGWVKNAYTPFKANYPVFPGESRRLPSSGYGSYDGNWRGDLAFASSGDGGINHR